MKSDLRSLQILLNARIVTPPLKFKSLQLILVLIFQSVFQLMLKMQYRIVGRTIQSVSCSAEMLATLYSQYPDELELRYILVQQFTAAYCNI